MTIRTVSCLLAVAFTATAIAQTTPPSPASAPLAGDGASTVDLKTESQRIGYSLGLQIGTNLRGVELDATTLAAGLRDASQGAKPRLTDAEIETALKALQQQVMFKANPKLAAEAEANQKSGDAFLADNAKKEGVKTTASGLQYKVLKTGKGKTPSATDTVSVNYRGTLTSGKEFDASRGEPASFPVNRVIAGWTEALQLMKEGDQWQLFIPASLAYGLNSPTPDIGPNSVLVFDVELLTVK